MVQGTVLLFRIGASAAPRHCGIFVGNGRFVHAQERLGVVEGNLTDGWAKRVVSTLAFPER
jgi:cell wall-associated NlpC family hydrolase